jgi:hypothetical protein
LKLCQILKSDNNKIWKKQIYFYFYPSLKNIDITKTQRKSTDEWMDFEKI